MLLVPHLREGRGGVFNMFWVFEFQKALWTIRTTLDSETPSALKMLLKIASNFNLKMMAKSTCVLDP
jgi:hypothetical protein